MGKWKIGDTSSDNKNKLKWNKFIIDNRVLLISDRVILVNVSFNELNKYNLIYGKSVYIDKKKYKLRVLTGGIDCISFDNDSKGTPGNEWDNFIINSKDITNLIKPLYKIKEGLSNKDKLNLEHNKIWNWYNNFTICQEIRKGVYGDNTSAIIRGYISSVFWDILGTSEKGLEYGWRPVL